MIDWAMAGRVGGLVAGEAEPASPLPGLGGEAEEAAAHVVAYTGLRPAAALPVPEPVDRRAWLDANLVTMSRTVSPLTERLAAGAPGPARAVGGALLGAEVGAMVGLFAQRVLGQYEIALLDPDGEGRLLLVAPNLDEAADRLSVDREELVRWVLVHEVTHAVQFSAVPWLRDHLGTLLHELLEGLDVRLDPGELLRLPSAGDLRGLVEAVRQHGLVGVAAGPARRDLLERIQATMALVEGHAEHVMDAVGGQLLPAVDRLREALERRRQDRAPALRLVERLLGLDMKLRQYQEGRRFCDAVVEQGGIAVLNRAWEAPDLVPTAAELAAPRAWLQRVA